MSFDFNNRRPASPSSGRRPTPPSGSRKPAAPQKPFDRSGGFSGAPRVRESERESDLQPSRNLPAEQEPRISNWGKNKTPFENQKPTNRGGRIRNGIQIPWRIIIPLLLIGGAVALCVIYRDVITAFLMQLLTWAIIILVVFLLVRGVIRRILR